MKDESYKTCQGCDADCPHDSDEEPCWGEVKVIDEIYTDDDYYWVHCCEGHEDIWDKNGKYKKKGT